MPRLLAALAALVAICLVAPPPASASAADPYPPNIPTEVSIDVDAEIAVGNDVVITYEVRANTTNGPIEGTLEISGGPRAAALAGGGGDSVLASSVQGTALAPDTFSQTHAYDDEPITVNVGSQPIGDYITDASFTPAANSPYLPSEGSATYAVVGDAADEEAGGILPDTGGPGAWWLLLALLLVAGGAGAVYYGRRRSS